MRIAVLTQNHIYSNLVVKNLLFKYQKNIVIIVESKTILQHKSFIQSLKKIYDYCGNYFMFIQILKIAIFYLLSKIIFLDRNNKFYHYHKLAKKWKIKVVGEKEVNSERFERVMKKYRPDLIVSVFFNQILKKGIIKVPPLGVINIHPAYLPNNKGLSPPFWCLVNNQKTLGVTIHYINEEIDQGLIIDRRKVKVLKNDTEDSLYWRCVKVGVPALLQAIDNIYRDQSKNHEPELVDEDFPIRHRRRGQATKSFEGGSIVLSSSIDSPLNLPKGNQATGWELYRNKNKGVDRSKSINNTKGTYNSLPTKEAVVRLRKSGKALVRWSEYLFFN